MKILLIILKKDSILMEYIIHILVELIVQMAIEEFFIYKKKKKN